MLYPKMNPSRAAIELGGIWAFRTAGAEDYPVEWAASPMKDAATMAVPGSYNDQKDDVNLRAHYGWAVYQRRFSVPKALRGERTVLRFGAVTHYADVYLNGKKLGSHKGGFLPFEFDVTDALSDGENLLTVAVDNRVNYSTLPVGNEGSVAFFGSDNPGIPAIELAKSRAKPQNRPNFDFFNYSGIHRPVWLYTTPREYIRDITLVPGIDGADGKVSYSVDVSGEGEVRVDILDGDGKTVASSAGASGEITIRNARLWQPGNAYLYAARVVFGEDEYEQPFGIRTIEVRGTEFLINGKPFYFKGFGKHEDSAFHGRGLDNCLNVKDLSLMRWLGANSFRTSHYPYSEEMMDLCDREGVVVIDEVPAVGIGAGGRDPYEVMNIREHHRDVVRDMIARDKNHPCVVMWSLANEPDLDGHPESALKYFTPLYDLAHASDPQNRPVTLVACQNNYERDITTRTMDVCCVNRYFGWYNLSGDLDAACDALNTELDFWEKLHKPFMLTEYGADTYPGVHNTNGEMFSEEFQLDYFSRLNAELDRRGFIVGEQLWNFADFSTIQGPMRVDGNKKGILTRDRRPKLAAHYLRKRWHEMK